MLLIWFLRVLIWEISLGEGLSCKFQNPIFEYSIASWVLKRYIRVFFHSVMVDGKKASLKNLSLKHKKHIKVAFSLNLVWYMSLQAGIKGVKKSGAFLSKILLKHQSFLFYRRSWRDSRSRFPYNFYLEVPFNGPVKAKVALYYIDSNLLQKQNL